MDRRTFLLFFPAALTARAALARPVARFSSSSVLLVSDSGKTIESIAAQAPRPIASITKLMTAMVVLDSRLPLAENIKISADDVDTLKFSSSKLPVGATLTRGQLLAAALVGSENRAAAALARAHPGGAQCFVATMNAKARSLSMNESEFADPTGLNPRNISTAQDLAKMVAAAARYNSIRQLSSTKNVSFALRRPAQSICFNHTNRFVYAGDDIEVGKTGFTDEAGSCIAMRFKSRGELYTAITLGAKSSDARAADVIRLKSEV